MGVLALSNLSTKVQHQLSRITLLNVNMLIGTNMSEIYEICSVPFICTGSDSVTQCWLLLPFSSVQCHYPLNSCSTAAKSSASEPVAL